METYISVERAQQLLIEKAVVPEAFENLPLLEALGRVAYHTIEAVTDQPPFDRSPLDGYAINHKDITHAAKDTPVTLHITETIYCGDYPTAALSAGQAARIMTGAPLPDGATCVIRQEDTIEEDGTVQILMPLKEYENYCFKGEDVSKGASVITRGERCQAAHIGVLAGQGYEKIPVYRKPRISILSTGSELLDPREPLSPGKIYDSNRQTLAARSLELGACVVTSTKVADEAEKIAAMIEKMQPDCDLLITTGGVSVGEKDYMPLVGELLECEMIYRGVNSKPGGAVIAFYKNGKVILSLTGNPFASYAMFEVLATPFIRKLAGESRVLSKRVQAVAVTEFHKVSKGRRLVRAKIEGGNVFFADSGHSSGSLGSLIDCNCMVDIPPGNKGVKKGDMVEVILF